VKAPMEEKNRISSQKKMNSFSNHRCAHMEEKRVKFRKLVNKNIINDEKGDSPRFNLNL
jgi:hypothetical protein